ncbi:MAG: aspartate kinase [Flaviaesturariibacter sp.]|nr:aspartate kinase [Flaviaesturariibacter sp.]
MKVFKFGGASVSTIDRIHDVASILNYHKEQKLLVVISAMGKTTNALEKVVNAFTAGNKEEALQLFDTIKTEHNETASQLGNPDGGLTDFFTEIEWLLHDKPVRDYDYYYDQIVCVGELLSTSIVSSFLTTQGITNTWIDVRDIIRTDANFRDARIDWTVTAQKVALEIQPLFAQSDIVLTQGFIGATDDNESTTLGREGSDYTAAVFANLLNAESQTIWKDVKGVMNADPKQYEKAEWIQELNYREVIEMAYYGAQVIHPKTIKPLQNKDIPLLVKSFINPMDPGTVIHNKNISHLPPIIVHKHDQVLVQLSSCDFSFVGEGLTAELYRIFERIKFKPNLTQNAAISLLCVVDNHSEKVDQLAHAASEYFDVQVIRELRLLTIRHYTDEVISELCQNCEVILKQQTPETLQVLLKDIR